MNPPGISVHADKHFSHVNAKQGFKTTSNYGNFKYSGPLTATANQDNGTPLAAVLNSPVGTVTFTEVRTIASTASTGPDTFNTLTISNNLVNSQTVGMVTFVNGAIVAANRNVQITAVTYGEGTIVITLTNFGSAATAGANDTYIFSFTLFNPLESQITLG